MWAARHCQKSKLKAQSRDYQSSSKRHLIWPKVESSPVSVHEPSLSIDHHLLLLDKWEGLIWRVIYSPVTNIRCQNSVGNSSRVILTVMAIDPHRCEPQINSRLWLHTFSSATAFAAFYSRIFCTGLLFYSSHEFHCLEAGADCNRYVCLHLQQRRWSDL